ncbi:MAG: DUF5131 family protein [Candidatus Methanosuratincola petrocarbonis]
MFSFITHTWNPVKYCSHECVYCWARRYGLDSKPKLYENRLNMKFPKDAFVFVCDLGDLFCSDMPPSIIERVVEVIEQNPQAKFLLMTKNPSRYDDVSPLDNVAFGVTIESNRNYRELSKAPKQTERLDALVQLDRAMKRTFVSVEPILDFDMDAMVYFLTNFTKAVAIGYDNYGHKLPEPPLEKTLMLIEELKRHGVKVFTKTLRPAWHEQDGKTGSSWRAER